MRSRIVWFAAIVVASVPLVAAVASENTANASASGEQIGLKTGDGASSASLVAQCSKVPFVGCVLGHREDRTVRFILPPGYKRVDFSLVETNKEGHSGGRATWASADPHDASIAIHAWADAFSKIEIVVSNVIGEKE